MGSKSKEEVRDGHLADLPEELRIRVMNVHKLIVTKARELFTDDNYKDIKDSSWAKTMLDEFLVEPSPKTNAGMVRIYKKGKRCRCMIQITGHVNNDRSDINHELFHDFIRNVHQKVKSKVRRKFDLILTCESEHGEPFEGFDIWTKQKDAKELWEYFKDKETKELKPYSESTMMIAEYAELPRGLQSYIKNAMDSINVNVSNIQYVEKSEPTLGTTILTKFGESAEGSILITDEIHPAFLESNEDSLYEAASTYTKSNPDPTKEVVFNGSYYEVALEPKYANVLYSYLEKNVSDTVETDWLEESVEFDPYSEASEPEGTSGLSESEARRVMKTLCQTMINDFNNNPNTKVSSYTASILSNLTTKNILKQIGTGFYKFTIILGSPKDGNMVKFITPAMTRDFVGRFVEGRENLNGLLHRNPEIKLYMSPNVFSTMKDPDDMYQFIKAAIKYYSKGVEKYSNQIMKASMSMSRELKHLVSTTNLSGIVIAPLKMVFAFDNVDLSNRKTFTINKEDINAVTGFMKSIYTRYASPEKEKSKIINDMNEVIESLHEAYGLDDDIRTLTHLNEEVTNLYDGKYNDQMADIKYRAIEEQVDRNWNKETVNGQIKVFQEKWGVKKLKKLPRDLVAYISIETEAIKDYNDKAMIASYCISKLDICEWYIELLEVGSKKYIVPHTLPYLKQLRTDLLQCYERIMKVKIDNKTNEVKIPEGYEG